MRGPGTQKSPYYYLHYYLHVSSLPAQGLMGNPSSQDIFGEEAGTSSGAKPQEHQEGQGGGGLQRGAQGPGAWELVPGLSGLVPWNEPHLAGVRGPGLRLPLP